jgi:NAD(P)H-flavin reductase
VAPARYRVAWRRQDNADTVTLALDPVDEPIPAGRPGQFHMVYAFGVGEVPLSISGTADAAGRVEHTVRIVGAVTAAIAAAEPGDMLGVRGPLGVGFDMPTGPLIILAGGLGLAPLRPVIRAAAERDDRATLLIGARTPDQLLYADQYDEWRSAGLDVRVTVDAAPTGWDGNVGVITTLLPGLPMDFATAAAVLCGPEPMMRFAGRDLVDLGTGPERIQVSLERNMHCGVGTCGRCQLGPFLLCTHGPVLTYAQVDEHWSVRGR